MLGLFDKGIFTKAMREELSQRAGDHKLAKRYKDKEGKTRWCGTQYLKSSQNLGFYLENLFLYMSIIYLILASYGQHIVCKLLLKHLRTYTMRFAWQLVRIMPRLQEDARRQPDECPSDLDVRDIFWSLDDDVWSDADMPSVVAYLKGNKHVQIPASWRPWLPTCL